MLSHAGRRPKLTLYVSVLASISVFSVVSFSVFRCGSLPRLRSTPVQALSEAPLLRVVSPQLHDIDASIPRHSTNSISTSSSAFTLNTSTPADKITTTVDGTGTRTAVDERSAPYTVEKGTRTAVDERSAPIVDSETKMISVRVNEDRRSVNRPAITDAKTTSKNMVRSNLTLPNIYTLQKTVAGRGTPTTTTVSKHKPTASQITGNTRDLFIGVPESCKEPNCMEFLSHTEKSIVKNCGAKVSRSMPANMVHKATCKFLQDNGRQPVALNSQEGSGNTWVRALLEGVTGICTGFNWECDAVLRAHGFLGEGIKSGKVLVVKTHVRRPKWMGEFSWHVQMISYEPSYQSAILILRHPALAMIADYNRQKSLGKDSHTHIVSPTVFASKDWLHFSNDYLDAWKTRMVSWIIDNNAEKHPVHVVRYEDLQRDTVGEVEKILDFLRFPYTHMEVVRKLNDNYTDFKRSHNHTNFQHFSDHQKNKLRVTLTETWELAKTKDKAELLRLDEYIAALDHIH